MKARSRTLLLATALGAVLAGLVAWALLAVERPDAAARARHDADARALPFRPGDVVSLSIAPRGSPEVRLERTGSGWSIVPSGGEANAAAVEGLLDRLSEMRVLGSLRAGPADLAARGLEPPSSRVTVTLRDGSALSLDLGDASAFDRTRFGRRGERVLAIEGVPPVALDPAPVRLLAAPGGG